MTRGVNKNFVNKRVADCLVEFLNEFHLCIFSRPTFVLFYANWCPYCQKLDPIWSALGEILSKRGYDVQVGHFVPVFVGWENKTDD